MMKEIKVVWKLSKIITEESDVNLVPTSFIFLIIMIMCFLTKIEKVKE